jgi:hypothetical protein
VSDFHVTTRDGHSIGLNEDGELWFNSCCDADNVYLTVEQALQLRRTLDTFLTNKGWFKRGTE